MQDSLFNTWQVVSVESDPYEEIRAAASPLAVEFGIGEAEAIDVILGYGSEDAARRALRQRILLGELPSAGRREAA